MNTRIKMADAKKMEGMLQIIHAGVYGLEMDIFSPPTGIVQPLYEVRVDSRRLRDRVNITVVLALRVMGEKGERYLTLSVTARAELEIKGVVPAARLSELCRWHGTGLVWSQLTHAVAGLTFAAGLPPILFGAYEPEKLWG